MKALFVFLLLCMTAPAYGQFYQQYAQPCPPQHGGDHSLLQFLAMQNMFSQQTQVQQGWHMSQSGQLSQILAQQEGFRNQQAQRDWFERVLQSQTGDREVARQRDLFERIQQQIQTSHQQYPYPQPQPPPRRRGIFGLRADANIYGGY